MSDFLFELGVEEVPVAEIKPILNQLKSLLQLKLQENQVKFGNVETAATNKRFMIYFGSINEKAEDKEEQIKGPAKRIAYDEQNKPTLALLKFLEFNQVQLPDISEIDTPKGVYLVVDKKTEGRYTTDILQEIIPIILKELTFGKNMAWNASRVSFVRPIKNILSIFDNNLITVEFAGTHSTYFIYGHTLLSDTPIQVKSYRDYCELLAKNFVIIREEDRKQKILDEIKEVEDEFNAHVRFEKEMLEDFIYNNEYPVIFHGQFDKKYLELPTEIITTFMIREKKLIPIFNKENQLLNIFVGVSNVPDESQNVKKGNERVIRATFEDAKFFWDNDRRDDFIGLREQLHNVTFHKDLGNFFEKTDRIAVLVDLLLKENNQTSLAIPLRRAAFYCKNDLVTRMVREFPSLQGIMGGLYLKSKDEPENTWKSVYSHYEPKGFQVSPLDHLGAGFISIADKMDSIAGFLSRDIKISSSKDPYGIRRDTNAIIKIILDFKLDFNLDKIITASASKFVTPGKTIEEIVKSIREHFFGRMENVLKDFLSYRYDVVNAVLNTKNLFIYRIALKTHDLSKIVQAPSVSELIALHRRLKNIIKDPGEFTISEDTFIQKEEKILYDIFKESRAKIESLMLNHRYMEVCSKILEMKPVIDNFFDKVMVMAEEQRLKENRIALVQQIDQLLSKIADFSLIVE